MEGLPCNWDACDYVAKTDSWTNNVTVMKLHERGKHRVKMAPVAQPKEEKGVTPRRRRETRGGRRRGLRLSSRCLRTWGQGRS